jgi:hypothetical protein
MAACGTAEEGIEIHDSWMRPAAQGDNGAAYFLIHNHSSATDELTGASSDAAQAVELHETTMTGDVMEMKMVESVPLEPDAEIEFAPGGLHVMLIGLKQDLNLGDHIELTLHFKNQGNIKVNVVVQEDFTSDDVH